MLKKFFTFIMLPFLVSASSISMVSATHITNNPWTVKDDGGATDGLQVIGNSQAQGDGLINVIRGFVNWVLGILALIALLVLLYAGFQMVTAAGNEEKYTSGFTMLKQAAVGLVMIGLAWFIISLIFFVIGLTTDTSVGIDGGTT